MYHWPHFPPKFWLIQNLSPLLTNLSQNGSFILIGGKTLEKVKQKLVVLPNFIPRNKPEYQIKNVLLISMDIEITWTVVHQTVSSLWQYGLWSFQTGRTKLERFLPKNQHTQRKLLNFETWVNGEVSKSAKIWLSKSIFYVKNYPNLSQFFFHWRISI